MPAWIQVILSLVGFALIVVGAVVYLKSDAQKTNNSELRDLVDTRGQKIDDLEAEVADLRREMDELRGQMKLLESLKAEEIAQRVVELLPG